MEIKFYSCDAIDQYSRVLPAGEVHVWYRSLERIPQGSYLLELLSAEERARADRYLVDRPRNTFAVTRATLRVLLASYLGRSAERLTFCYSAQGKPSLANEATDLRFNVSHTDGLAALAFVRGREIGVDVEKVKPDCEAGKLAERFFSPAERQAISRFSGIALQEAFFRCWTRKEAFIKAKGGGLSIPLDQFDVSVAKDQPVALLGTRPDAKEARRWMLYDLPVEAGYAGALAVSTVMSEREMPVETSAFRELTGP